MSRKSLMQALFAFAKSFPFQRLKCSSAQCYNYLNHLRLLKIFKISKYYIILSNMRLHYKVLYKTIEDLRMYFFIYPNEHFSRKLVTKPTDCWEIIGHLESFYCFDICVLQLLGRFVSELSKSHVSCSRRVSMMSNLSFPLCGINFSAKH